MLAVYPQFLSPRFGPPALAAGAGHGRDDRTQLVVYGGLALAAGRSRDIIVESPAVTSTVGKIVGGLLIAVALLTAWQEGCSRHKGL